MIETEYTAIDLRCAECHARWSPAVARRINADSHPEARRAIVLGVIHRTQCPRCGTPTTIDAIFEYYDPQQALLIECRPDWEIRAGGGEEWYWQRYEDLVLRYADVPVRVDVVFGVADLIEKYLGGQAAGAAAQRERDVRQLVESPDAGPAL